MSPVKRRTTNGRRRVAERPARRLDARGPHAAVDRTSAAFLLYGVRSNTIEFGRRWR
jgi:hypothetical protein